MQPLSFYLAGTMQGSNEGIRVVDQRYREELKSTVYQAYPDAIIHCPHSILHERFGKRGGELIRRYQALQDHPVVTPHVLDTAASEIIAAFHDLVTLAGESDVVIAYLPDHQASMGTAIEMWQAKQRGRAVVSITEMRQNLAIASTSTVMLPTIAAFAEFLAEGSLNPLVGCPQS